MYTDRMGPANDLLSCCFGFLMCLAQILLHGALVLVLYWVFMFHPNDGNDSKPGQDQTDEFVWPFAWKTEAKKIFWIHPVLMITGFIYFMGQCMSFFFLLSQAFFEYLARNPCIDSVMRRSEYSRGPSRFFGMAKEGCLF